MGTPRRARPLGRLLSACRPSGPLRCALLLGWCAGFLLSQLAASSAQSPSTNAASEQTVRLRIAWGSGDSAQHRWFGSLTAPSGQLSELQPLGIEPDAPAAVRLAENRVEIQPLLRRSFDGCDLTYTGDLSSVLQLTIRADQASERTRISLPLAEMLNGQFKQEIDTLGSYVLAYRAPGDRLRLVLDRDQLLFVPGENWRVRLRCDLAHELADGPLNLVAKLRSSFDESIAWEDSHELSASHSESELQTFDLPLPTTVGAYRLVLTAQREPGLATRFVPGQQEQIVARREVDLLVVNQQQPVAPLGNSWEPILTIDPANPSWWRLLPGWAKVGRLRSHSTSGNVRLLPQTDTDVPHVRLPPRGGDGEPPWQAFALPVQELGKPHVAEIAYPRSANQHLALAILQTDAAGRLTEPVIDSGIYNSQAVDSDSAWDTHRIVFWPRTKTPHLLVANMHPENPAAFGEIKLYEQGPAATDDAPPASVGVNDLLCGTYLASPNFAADLQAPQQLDAGSGMSVHAWSTYYAAAERLVQLTKHRGQNTLVLCVAAEGSTLYPSHELLPSPRFDTGRLAASGQDPLRKDVLELLFRLCDAEGIEFFPTLRLSNPLPALEKLRQQTELERSGISLLDSRGRDLRGALVSGGGVAYGYNLLHPKTQNAIQSVVGELLSRYAHHRSFAGIGIQVEKTGYGLLPSIDAGFDEATLSAFMAATGTQLPPDPLARSQALLGEAREKWATWRAAEVTAFYSAIAGQVRQANAAARVLLLTEDLVQPPAARHFSRDETAPQRLAKFRELHGLDLTALAQVPGLQLSNTTWTGAEANTSPRLAATVQGSGVPAAIEQVFPAR